MLDAIGYIHITLVKPLGQHLDVIWAPSSLAEGGAKELQVRTCQSQNDGDTGTKDRPLPRALRGLGLLNLCCLPPVHIPSPASISSPQTFPAVPDHVSRATKFLMELPGCTEDNIPRQSLSATRAPGVPMPCPGRECGSWGSLPMAPKSGAPSA